MKKYGDTVLFRRGAATVNALVLQSSVQPDGEHLTIVYLDPAFASPILSGSASQQAIATAFTVPLKEGQVQGWVDAETISDHDLGEMRMNFADAKASNDAQWEKQIEALQDHLNAPRVLSFGLGQVVSTTGHFRDLPAVYLEPATAPGTVGTDANYPKDQLQPGTVILEFHNAEGAQVLIEDVAAMYPGGGPPPTHPGEHTSEPKPEETEKNEPAQ